MKKCFSLLLICCLLIGMLPAAAAAPTDINDAELKEAVSLLSALGAVSGFSDNTFRPQIALTRAQFCKIAVVLGDREDVSAFMSFTLFPDVRAGHWARGYIGAAVKELKLITGYPDGTFKPEEPITFAAAVTILMKMLGYTEVSVGVDWPRGYLDKAKAIGLTQGITLKAGDIVTRGIGAKLFYNLCFTETVTVAEGVTTPSGKDYIQALGASPLESVVLLETEALSADGHTKGVRVSGGDGFYPDRAGLSKGLEGKRGKLLVSKDKEIIRFTPDAQTSRTVTVYTAQSASVTLSDKTIVSIPAGTVLYTEDPEQYVTTYEAVAKDLRRGETLTLYIKPTGALDYILYHGGARFDETVAILYDTQNANPLVTSFGEDARYASVTKNGVETTAEAIARLDIVLYNRKSNHAEVSSVRLTAPYDTASPSLKEPETVDILGNTFPVSAEAAVFLSGCKPGARVTFFLDANEKIAYACPAEQAQADAYGLFDGSSVTLPSGLTLTGSVDTNADSLIGALVSVSGGMDGAMTMIPLPYNPMKITYSKTEGIVGGRILSPVCVYYDRVGDGIRAGWVEASEVPESLAYDQISHMELDTQGRVSLLVLNKVTGDGYTYGNIGIEKVQMDITEQTILSVTGISGTISGRVLGSAPTLRPGTIYGAAFTRSTDGTSRIFKEMIPCVPLHDIKASAFTDAYDGVRIDGRLVPIAPDATVSIAGQMYTVQDGLDRAQTFSLYLDKAPEEGGKVRFLTGSHEEHSRRSGAGVR